MTYQYSGGPLLSNALYVERAHDREIADLLLAGRHLLAVTAPRQSGKTSTLERLGSSLVAVGHVVAIVDLRDAVGSPPEKGKHQDFFYNLFNSFVDKLDLPEDLFESWINDNCHIPSARLVRDFFSNFLRKFHQEPLLIGIDEIDWVQLHSYQTDDLFEGLRLLASEREKNDISIVLAGINHPTDLLKALPPSTFNILTDVILKDFGTDEKTVAAWADGLPWDEATRQAVGRQVLEQTGGQPYLTAVLFQDVLDAEANDLPKIEVTVSRLIEDLRSGQRLKPHIQAPSDVILAQESRAWLALTLYEHCLEEPVSARAPERSALALLRLSGLVRERSGLIEVKSPIYRQIFDKRWIAETQARIGTHKAIARRQKKGATGDAICLITTGGMIAMDLGADGRIIPPHSIDAFIDDFPEIREFADIDPLNLTNKDSSNMLPADWKTIAQAIYQRRNRGYKGFVVAHGTDTLAYTASAVAYALGPGLDFPVVFTASQVPRYVLHGDARINLLRACTVATKPIPEVVVSISDHVYRAVRVEKKDDYRFDALHSPTFGPLAIVAGEVELQHHLIRRPDKSRLLECNAEFSEGVFKFSLYPGLDPAFLRPVLENPNLKGIIIETFGIGVLPTEGKHSLLPMIEEATQRLIPVLLVSQYPIQKQMSEVYELATLPIQAGAIVAAMSAPAAVTKFMWVLPQVENRIISGDVLPGDKLEEVKQYMNRDLIGELTARAD